ncbi:MAG: hypothetical protein UY28_C0044G0016 [Candidatus Amesbacteria bacterium GW2011_GWB1_48_13]|uniref:Uncharacterized protein n=1 Tax=Candidatus Amesbacteria bacterium GW2011_GWB1_48_13 TaxID=1618362 RepID=A0A0G1WZN2_9BACT|nr:MAG: hypothetical protein UY28_C0044G0016 [Candidatus Amesbacteria bacterium GW2011_GWB1_48_13]
MGNNSEAGRCLNDTLCRKIGGFNDFIVIELTLSDRLRVDAEAADIGPLLATAFRMQSGTNNKESGRDEDHAEQAVQYVRSF